ncbi:MAG: sugar ABC transporter substrate-binding protein [Gemmatimonadetes bacterium]|uniref:Sugar ABC transporter substrate-binding protein n=1 Tax=Candidatus Kutchimonas denitrificans TaxID=3056748 RepID=A0AAE4Z8B2_9BACT|nr:sugar ABC transporter substrate-binding protein [Gemmatimonadota bacterium]NIR74833.1 sugar ABC transporter substrate-binding protein [Candidatus Kutchimonas denitrificans]NIR99944.1 sugar ABC transporter substrate-binding protein [Gemmatimonadota bacterium]NIT65528.1 sugar ABC transporter substrate-binding protein [Gemmatimonadota bacterium]NIU52498.1 extracellular solute-binding protein [Gemmatimonadota bacterium]
MTAWRTLVTFTLVASACAEGTDERTVLRVMAWAGPDERAIEQRILDRFSEARPGIEIEFESISANYRERLLTSIVAGTPPDVALLDNGSFGAAPFIARDLLVNVAAYLDRVGVDTSAYYSEVLDIFRRPAGLYAFPKDFNPIVVYLNVGLFERASVPLPDWDWTWQDFERIAVRLTRDTDGDGRNESWGTLVRRNFYLWQPWVWAAGGDVLGPEGRQATGYLNSPETETAIRFLTDLVTEHRVVPSVDVRRQSTGLERNFFLTGRIGMIWSGHWWLPRIRRYIEEGRVRVAVLPLPRYDGRDPVTVIYAAGWAVPHNTRHKKLAVELAAHLSSAQSQRERAEYGLAIPSIRAVHDSIAAADPYGLEQAFLQATRHGRMSWGSTVEEWAHVEVQLPDIFDRVIFEDEPIHRVTTDIAERIDRILAARGTR